MGLKLAIIYFVLSIFVAIIILKIFEKQINQKTELNKKNICLLLLISLLNWLNNMFTLLEIRGFVSSIIIFILLQSIFNEKWKKTVYYTIIISCTMQFLDVALALLLPSAIKNVEVLNQSIIFKIALSIGVNVVLYFILTNKYVIKFFINLKDTSKSNKLFYIIGIGGLLICNLWLTYLSKDVSNKSLNIILCVTELTIFILVILSLRNKYERNISLIKEEQLKQNLELYTKVAGEYKELKHNLMNDLLIIKTKIAKKEQPFFNDVIQKYKSNYEWVNAITDIPEGLQGLVFLKKHQAELKKITFNFESNVNKSVNKNNNFKLYEALGIIFDNAIEAASESKEKIINIIFSEEKNKITIKVMNTFNNSIDLDKIGDKDYSTKNRGSGIGLNYLKKQKNKFKIQQSIRENIFITEIVINTEKNKRKK